MRNIKKTDPLFQSFMKVYYEWFQTKVGVKPKIDIADGKALKIIVKYFRSITDNNLSETEELEDDNKKNSDLQTLLAWEYIFAHYEKWDKFHQKQLNLRHINSNLMNIINSIKNGKQTAITGSIQEERNRIGNLDE